MEKSTVTYYGENPVIHLPEKLTMANSALVKKQIALLGNGTELVVVDLAGTNLVDSSGLSVLVANKDVIKCLLSPNVNVLSLLELTRLHEIFIIVNSIKGALDL